MIPPYSCDDPGRYPGISTSVMMGMLKQSQVRTKRAALRLASMSSTPARCIGWFPTNPTVCPPIRANPTTTFGAKVSWISKKSASSTIR